VQVLAASFAKIYILDKKIIYFSSYKEVIYLFCIVFKTKTIYKVFLLVKIASSPLYCPGE